MVTVAHAPTIVVATSLRSLLQGAGIPAEVVGTGLSSIYPGAGRIGTFDVVVPDGEADRARELIAAAEREDGEGAVPGGESRPHRRD